MPEQDILDVNVDIVLCIDSTGSMSPVIEMVKKSATSFFDELRDALAEQNREIDHLRLKVISFRDLRTDPKDIAVQESRFFELPEENEEFQAFVRDIRATGGGDAPETALDIIAHAMRSDWNTEGVKKRHVIMLWTDAPTCPPTGGCGVLQGLPSDLDGIWAMWQDEQNAVMNQSAKRLVLFVPRDESWDFATSLENCTVSNTGLNEGMSDIDMSVVMTFLSKSI
ncbi:MAG: vWA domain-containing protein [Thermoplasmata archaeon]|nr:vWA domain-containing protein [Thermoplasmata archaeon]